MGTRTREAVLRRRRAPIITLTLRFDDGMVTYRITTAEHGGGRAFRPVIGSSVVATRVRRLVDAILSEAQPATGGDALWEQLPLFSAEDGRRD